MNIMNDTDPFLQEKIIKSSEGYKINLLLGALDSSYYIFDKNYMDLKLILTTSSMPDFMLPMLDYRDRSKLNNFLEEIRRKLHNFLAAATTLIDHSRNVINDTYENNSFQAEYKHEINNRFNSDPLCRFILNPIKKIINKL